jgi:YceI-like domain
MLLPVRCRQRREADGPGGQARDRRSGRAGGGRRRRVLAAGLAELRLAPPAALATTPAPGTVRADASGRLTVHGTTREVTLPLEGRWNGDTIQVAGSLPIAMTDFGIQPPQIGPVVSTQDTATMELQLVFERG